MKENARRRKKRELGRGDWWEESNRRRGEGGGTGNLSEVRRLRATRDLFAWAKSLRAVLLCIYIFRVGNTPTGGWCILNSCRRILIHQFHVSGKEERGKERGEGWLAEREREREKRGSKIFFLIVDAVVVVVARHSSGLFAVPLCFSRMQARPFSSRTVPRK